MVSIFFMLVLLLPVFSGFGSFFSKFLGNFSLGFSSKIMVGIFSVSIIYTLLAFFIPLSIFVEIIAVIMGLFFFFFFKNYKEFWIFITENKWLFSIIAIIIIFFGSYYPFILDHFGYYLPTIKWISEIGLVQGISNLDLLLGQMSVWHILQAGFSNFTDPFLRINVLILVVYLIYILEKKSWIHQLFLPVLFLFSQSPSPDLPAIVFSLIILNEVLKSNKKRNVTFRTFNICLCHKTHHDLAPYFYFSLWFNDFKGQFKIHLGWKFHSAFIPFQKYLDFRISGFSRSIFRFRCILETKCTIITKFCRNCNHENL